MLKKIQIIEHAKDRFGKQINVGDVITYPVSGSYHSASSSLAVVYGFKQYETYKWHYEVKVVTIKESCLCRRFSDYGEFNLNKKVIVDNAHQMIVERCNLPEEYIELLLKEGFHGR